MKTKKVWLSGSTSNLGLTELTPEARIWTIFWVLRPVLAQKARIWLFCDKSDYSQLTTRRMHDDDKII